MEHFDSEVIDPLLEPFYLESAHRCWILVVEVRR